MQIQILLQHFIKKSQKLNTLLKIVSTRQQKCLQKANTEAYRKHCQKDINDYNEYIKQYKKQFVEKGEEICMNSLADGIQPGMNAQQELKSKFEQRRKCITFYMKSLSVFEQNVKDKLNSLVNKLQYTQL